MKGKPHLWIAGSVIAFLGLLFVTLGAYLRMVNAVPAYAPRPVPLPNPNAFDDYAAGALLLREPSDLTPPGPAEPTSAVLRQSAKDNRAGLARLREGFAHEYLNPPRYGFSALFPEMACFRSAARVLSAEGLLAVREHRPHDAARDCIECIRIGTDVPRGGVLIHWLVGIAIQGIGLSRLETTISHLDAGAARYAARELVRLDEHSPTLADMLSSEQEFSLVGAAEQFRKLHAPHDYAALLAGTSGSSGASPQEVWQGVELYLTPKWTILNHYRAYMEALIRNARQPYYRHPAPPPLPKDSFSRVMAPTYAEVAAGGARASALLRVMEVRLAVRAFTLEHGAPPRSIQALVPGYLPRIPRDPFAPRSITYRLKQGRPLVYSVGPDGVDDGGRSIKGPVSSGSRGDLVHVRPQK